MTFTNDELLCFNSVLDGAPIFGVKLKVPDEPDESYIQKTADTLRGKKYLDNDGNVNGAFVEAVDLLKAYKAAETHLFINRARLAINEKDVITLAPVRGGYQTMQIDKRLYFQNLVLGIPYLCAADNIEECTKGVSRKGWRSELLSRNEYEDLLMIEKFTGQDMNTMKVFYHSGDTGFVYNPFTEKLLTCGPWRMRMELMELLEIEVDKEAAQ